MIKNIKIPRRKPAFTENGTDRKRKEYKPCYNLKAKNKKKARKTKILCKMTEIKNADAKVWLFAHKKAPAGRQFPIRKHREERENGIASAVPFSHFSVDAVTFDISKAPIPL